MDKIMQTYFERWKFDHPCARDFISVVNEVVWEVHGNRFGDNMNWFFDQVLYSADICDYKVASITNTERRDRSGFFDDLDNCDVEEDSNSDQFIASVVLHRVGEVKLPIEVLVQFDDGSQILENWDGQDRTYAFTYEGNKKIECVEIDPERKIYIDKTFLNNSLTTGTQRRSVRKYFSQFLNWVQNSMQSMSVFI